LQAIATLMEKAPVICKERGGLRDRRRLIPHCTSIQASYLWLRGDLLQRDVLDRARP